MARSGSTHSRPLQRLIEPLGSRFGWSMVVEFFQLASSVLLVLFLSRVFTRTEFGNMGAVQALAGNVLSIAGLGTHLLLLGRASRGEPLDEAFGRAVGLGVISTSIWLMLMLVLRPVLLPQISLMIYLPLAAGNLVFYWISELAVYLMVGLGRLRSAAEIRAMLFVIRLSALGILLVLDNPGLVDWAWLSAGAMLIGSVVSLVYVRRSLGLMPSLRQARGSDVGEGLPYAVSGGSESMVDRADVWMLSSYGHPEDTAYYANGGRIVQFGYLPMRILMKSMDSQLFKAGGEGLIPALRVTVGMVPQAVILAAASSVGLYVIAPAVPLLLGPDKWAEVVQVIRLMSILPLLRVGQYLLGNVLTASQHQWWRFSAVAASLITNVGLNVLFLPNGTWRTAAYTTFASETVMAVVLAVVVAILVRRESGRGPGRLAADGPAGR